MRTGIIYMARNLVNGKCYIGLTKHSLDWRRHRHEYHSKNPRTHFHHALRLHGAKNFEWSVLRANIPIDKLNAAEMCWIAKLKPEYNCTAGGDGLLNPSRQVRVKLSAAVKKVWSSSEYRAHYAAARMSPEYHARVSAALKKACTSPEYRARLSAVQKKAWSSPKVRARHAAAMASPEARARMSTAIKKAWASLEYRARQSVALKKRWSSSKARARLSATLKKAWSSPEVRARQSAISKKAWEVRHASIM